MRCFTVFWLQRLEPCTESLEGLVLESSVYIYSDLGRARVSAKLGACLAVEYFTVATNRPHLGRLSPFTRVAHKAKENRRQAGPETCLRR